MVVTIESVTEIAPHQWNALNLRGNPFVRHEFLAALEKSGCVGGSTGWDPCYTAVFADAQRTALRAAVPAYRKHHSWGEYIFDFAWSNAYHRAGLRYYPKLVVAVPFTPVTGPRFLVDPQGSPELFASLAETLIVQVRDESLSGVQGLFVAEDEYERLSTMGWSGRSDCQFHWVNAGYRDFGDFLAAFSSKRRKNVNRERRHVREAGIRMKVLKGMDVDAVLWEQFYQFYLSTVLSHGGKPYLNLAFFQILGERLADAVVMVVAEKGGQPVAASLNLLGEDALYGRYWGCRENYSGLHFETCYYSALEFCIDNRLSRFEAGAQGHHKLHRGFLPTKVYSANWLSHPQFADAVQEYVVEEGREVAGYMEALRRHSPFRKE